MKTQKQIPYFYGWINAAILFFIYFAALGVAFYGFVVIFPAMIEATGWGRGEAALAHTLRTVVMGFLAPLVALTIKKAGSRRTIIFGLFIMFISTTLLGTVTTELWHWTFIWGFLIPIGFAFGGFLPVQTTIMHWFNIRRATVTGIILSGAAFGGFLAQPILTWLIQKTGTWQTGWRTVACCALFALILSFWVKGKPSDIGQFPDNIDPGEAEDPAKKKLKVAKTYRTSEIWTLRDAIATPALWFLAIAMMANSMSVYLITVHGVLHLTGVGYTQMEAASVLSFIILGSGLARFPMGVAGDHIEPRWILTGAFLLMLTGILYIWKAPSLTVLMIAGPVFGFSYGTCIILSPVILGNYYSPDTFTAINGTLAPIMIIISAPVPVAAGYIADKTGSYDLAFLILSIIIGIALICAAFMAPPRPKGSLDC